MSEGFEPQVTIIYVPGTGETHGINAHQSFGGAWKYSPWIIRPEGELEAVLKEARAEGCTVLDVRAQAQLQRPGMESATPILIAHKGIGIHKALAAFTSIHNAILNSLDEKTS